MKKYCLPETPSIFWLHSLKYECKKCRRTSQFYVPRSGDGVVNFESQMTHQIKWLPEYGTGGYLDLFNKLVPNFHGEMIPKVVDAFVAELNNYIEKDDDDYFIVSRHRQICIYCQSKDLKELSEEVLTNPDLDWLKISYELIES